jgi:hypothetical protein
MRANMCVPPWTLVNASRLRDCAEAELAVRTVTETASLTETRVPATSQSRWYRPPGQDQLGEEHAVCSVAS